MLTLEVHNQFITWPDEFAVVMMRYYHHHGIPFKVHRKCVHTGWPGTGSSSPVNTAGTIIIR
jgi:hypothetical protein